MTTDKRKKVLIRVDIQNGFMPLDPAIPGTGELPVPDAQAIVPAVNRLSQSDFFDLIVDTQDFHPADHGSFYTSHPGKAPGDIIELMGLQQILWQPHCRQGTPGSDFYPSLDRSRVTKVFRKGTDKLADSYSGFWDNGRRKSTGLAEYLREQDISDVYVVGITRPVCASLTAKDAGSEGFETYLIEDACSVLELKPGEIARDGEELKNAGIRLIVTADVLRVTAEQADFVRRTPGC